MWISRRDWPRVRVVFEHALSLPVSERSFYVAEACRDNTDIRSQVERMLASHERAPQFLETPVAVSLADVASPLSLDGTQIGPYQLGTRIGAGGMDI
jgi:eukaryotic-like serine/threonine-protein kinase